MNVKLTLTLDKAVIIKAKVVARKSGRSLSDMVETYLKTQICREATHPSSNYSPLVSTLEGSIKLPEGSDYKQELKSALANKYK